MNCTGERRIGRLCAKRTAVPPGGYSPSVIANVQARRLSPGTLVARNWPTKSCNLPAGSRPPGFRAQLPTVGLSRTKRDPARIGHRASTCGNTDVEGTVPGMSIPRPRRPWAAPVQAADLPGSGPQLAHRHRERSLEPLPDAGQARSADRA